MEYRTMQICHNTDLITLCKKQKEIKTVDDKNNISFQPMFLDYLTSVASSEDRYSGTAETGIGTI